MKKILRCLTWTRDHIFTLAGLVFTGFGIETWITVGPAGTVTIFLGIIYMFLNVLA